MRGRFALLAMLLGTIPMRLYAQYADSVLRVLLPGTVVMEMVWVEGGSFIMGSNETPKDVKLTYDAAKPEHRVSVDGFFIGRCEVTQEQWAAVMGAGPSHFAGSRRPVESISWDEAQQFATLVSQMTGHRFRLPYEAEWEYAARGGQKGRGEPFAGFQRKDLDTCAWFCVNSERTTHDVALKQPNELGLYDMCGNVAEWCMDWVDAYTPEEQSNPHGPASGEHRVLRGGHYNSISAACTVFDRSWYIPSGKYEYNGMRLVMLPDRANTETINQKPDDSKRQKLQDLHLRIGDRHHRKEPRRPGERRLP